MKVGLLTENQKDSLIGIKFASDSYFNPILTGDEKWVISLEEINGCVNQEFQWVKSIPLIEFIPPEVEEDVF